MCVCVCEREREKGRVRDRRGLQKGREIERGRERELMNTSREPAAPVATRKRDGNKQLNRKIERERDRLNMF